MRSLGTETKGFAELNHHMRDERREVRNGVAGEGQGVSEEDEFRIDHEYAEEDDRCISQQVWPVVGGQEQQQRLQVPALRWEGFLELKSIMVLLVESDESTRYVVSALLRNCGYEG